LLRNGSEPVVEPGGTPPELAALRGETLHQLERYLPASELAGAMRCAERLRVALPHPRLDHNVVLVAYGGGKDSSYTLAFVRTIQLIIHARYGETFRLRTVTNRHAGMPQAVMDNIERTYRALRILDDRPGCEALLVDGHTVKPYRVDEPLAAEVVERNRLDLLMTGHRTGGEGRPTFCNACNLSMVSSFGLAAAYDGGVDLVITGDSPQEQRSYYLWVNQLARRFGKRGATSTDVGFQGFLRTTNDIAAAYFSEIYGPDATREIDDRRVAHDVGRDLTFFSIFADTGYSSSMHWDFLIGFLEFQFDEIAFSFTESDCGNPTLMAHLRGLRCERLYGRRYDEGLDEYIAFAESLMRQKEFPERLIETIRQRYEGPDAAILMRERANRFAQEAFGLTEEQLVCMLYAPFAGAGARLHQYLEREQPPHLAREVDSIHAILADHDADSGTWDGMLRRISGLEIDRLRTLYQSSIIQPEPEDRTNIVNVILAGDPHKQMVKTQRTPEGPIVRELLSGR